jgi:hypothetical protein
LLERLKLPRQAMASPSEINNRRFALLLLD